MLLAVQVVVLTYELYREDLPYLVLAEGAPPWHVAVFDEVHRLKNDKCALAMRGVGGWGLLGSVGTCGSPRRHSSSSDASCRIKWAQPD